MTCKTCGTRLTPWSNGDCGKHPAPREQRIYPTSPWVRRAQTSTLPVKDLTNR
jgi:hypothetical protein